METTASIKPLGEKAKCKAPGCRAVIYWAPHPKSGKLVPHDANGKMHFGTCKDLAFFSERKKERAKQKAELSEDDNRGNR